MKFHSLPFIAILEVGVLKSPCGGNQTQGLPHATHELYSLSCIFDSDNYLGKRVFGSHPQGLLLTLLRGYTPGDGTQRTICSAKIKSSQLYAREVP